MIIVNIFIYLFINTILYIISEPRVRKNIFGNFSVRFLFSCVRASYDLCARAHAHSLEGTLVPTWRLVRDSNPRPSGRKALSLSMRHHAQTVLYCNCTSSLMATLPTYTSPLH